VEQHQIALIFARPDVMERQAIEPPGKPRQLVIMGCEQGPALDAIVHRLDHCPGDRQPVIGRRAAPDLVEDHQAPRRRLREDRGGLDHLDHEGRPPARQIVRRADAAEQAVDEAHFRAARGDEAAGLGEHNDQRRLAQEGRFAAHVRPGDQPQAVAGP
jgi:hypothetical protein